MKTKISILSMFLLLSTFAIAQVEGDDEIIIEESDTIYVEESDTIFVEEADTIDIDDIDIDDIEVDDIEEDELAKQSNFPWERFAVGGTLGNLQFGDVTSIGLSPEVNYSLNDMFSVGIGGVYEYFKVKRGYDRFTGRVLSVENGKRSNTGYRPYLRFKPVQTFPVFAQLEFEHLQQEQPIDSETTSNNSIRYITIEQGVNNYNAGLGFLNGPYYIALLYNFSNKKNKDDFFQKIEDLGYQPVPEESRDQFYPYNALMFRTGLNIPLGGGSKNRKRKK